MMNLKTSNLPSVGARVVLPDGRTGFIERRAVDKNGVPWVWVQGDRYPMAEISLPKIERLSSWYGTCPKCHQNASDYVRRQKIDGTWVGGFAFCEPCLVTWDIPARKNKSPSN